jgi:hypothetical protein
MEEYSAIQTSDLDSNSQDTGFEDGTPLGGFVRTVPRTRLLDYNHLRTVNILTSLVSGRRAASDDYVIDPRTGSGGRTFSLGVDAVEPAL